MSNDNGGGGIGALIVGLGFAGLLMLPVILIQRFGARAMLIVCAAGMTVLAAVQPALLGWVDAERLQCAGARCPADALYALLAILPTWGWWGIVIVGWTLVWLRVKAGLDSSQQPISE